MTRICHFLLCRFVSDEILESTCSHWFKSPSYRYNQGFIWGWKKRGNATPHVCKKGVELPIANEKRGRGLQLQLGVENLHWINE